MEVESKLYMAISPEYQTTILPKALEGTGIEVGDFKLTQHDNDCMYVKPYHITVHVQDKIKQIFTKSLPSLPPLVLPKPEQVNVDSGAPNK